MRKRDLPQKTCYAEQMIMEALVEIATIDYSQGEI